MEEKIENIIDLLILSILTAFATYIFFIFHGSGAFTVCDDFNTQQLTFATAVRNHILNGMGQWNWNLDLGSSLITGFSFYNLGSPFFWISLLFPDTTFPYLAGWIYMTKHVVACITSYLYLELFVKDKRYAIIGALLYSFSGFQTTNLMFYHFHDVVAFFPLLLYNFEKLIINRRNTNGFIFSVFINCMINYFFFVGEVVFLAIYFFFRMHKTRHSFKIFLECLLLGTVGVGLSALIFLPNVIYVLNNQRGEPHLYLSNMLYDFRNILFLIKGFLLPADAMNNQSAIIFQNWNSTSCYLPFIGITAVIAYLRKNNDWISKVLITLTFFSFSPILSSSFLLFTESYQRWWYMLIIIMILASIRVMDNICDYNISKYAYINIAFVVFFYILIRYFRWSNSEELVYHKLRFFGFMVISASGPFLFSYLIKNKNFNAILLLTIIFSIGTSFITLFFYRKDVDVNQYMSTFNTGLQLNVIDEQYRYNSTDNVLMLTGDVAGIGCFSSTIENSSREFDTLFDYYGSNFTAYRENIDGLSELLAGKYSIMENVTEKDVVVDLKETSGRRFYITETEACPIGFSVDHYIFTDEVHSVPVEHRAKILMNAIVLDPLDQDVQLISQYLTHLDLNSFDYSNDINSFVERTNLNKVDNFTRNSFGFSCTTDYSSERVVFFSVPNDKGWHASIDGINTKIINSGGMISIVVPEGNHRITFSYETPGFKQGIAISIVSSLIVLLLNLKRRR